MVMLADELATCLRRFIEVTADDGTLARAERALAAWDRLARATGTSPAEIPPGRATNSIDLALPVEWAGSPGLSVSTAQGGF
jgi:hypothetical protein